MEFVMGELDFSVVMMRAVMREKEEYCERDWDVVFGIGMLNVCLERRFAFLTDAVRGMKRNGFAVLVNGV